MKTVFQMSFAGVLLVKMESANEKLLDGTELPTYCGARGKKRWRWKGKKKRSFLGRPPPLPGNSKK